MISYFRRKSHKVPSTQGQIWGGIVINPCWKGCDLSEKAKEKMRKNGSVDQNLKTHLNMAIKSIHGKDPKFTCLFFV